jgi:hypothetical protein
VDIRFISWAGYDLLGYTDYSSVTIQTPSLEGKQVAKTAMVVKEISPSIRSRFSSQVSTRIVHDELRPFPGPRNV